MTEKVWATLIIGIISTMMILARRYNNKDHEIGGGIAGWTIFILFLIWV